MSQVALVGELQGECGGGVWVRGAVRGKGFGEAHQAYVCPVVSGISRRGICREEEATGGKDEPRGRESVPRTYCVVSECYD